MLAKSLGMSADELLGINDIKKQAEPKQRRYSAVRREWSPDADDGRPQTADAEQ